MESINGNFSQNNFDFRDLSLVGQVSSVKFIDLPFDNKSAINNARFSDYETLTWEQKTTILWKIEKVYFLPRCKPRFPSLRRLEAL
jgi:hypothetical protein